MSAKILQFEPKPKPTKARGRHPVLALPFVVNRKRGDPRGRCFWHVLPTGDYSVDLGTGEQLALHYLDFRDCMPPPLQWIVADMPRDLTGIEIGFLRLVGLAASPERALQICAYESRKMAEFAARNGDDPEGGGMIAGLERLGEGRGFPGKLTGRPLGC